MRAIKLIVRGMVTTERYFPIESMEAVKKEVEFKNRWAKRVRSGAVIGWIEVEVPDNTKLETI